MENKQYNDIIIQYLNANLEYSSKRLVDVFNDLYNIPTKQMSVMWYLGLFKRLTMTNLAEKVKVSKQQTTKLVDVLVNKDYVKRVYNESNRRIIEVELTAKGQEIVENATFTHITHFLTLMDDLNEKEKEEFINSIIIVTKYLERFNKNNTNVK